jgi:signal transduction histidine kinase/DNA-binding response OmpR family regulator
MKARSNHRRTVLVWTALMLSASAGLSQPSPRPKRVLVLNWYDRDATVNVQFNEELQAALRSSEPGIEYYSEYLETNKFPGENQSLFLRDYLHQKYTGRTIDVVVTRASPPLDFLLKYHDDLFPQTPIVFATERAVTPETTSESGATGIVYLRSHATTLDLAMKLHPDTKEVFVVSGTLDHDKSFESIARESLQSYQNKVAIHYLTDLSLEQLTSRVRDLPKDSIVIYVWQQLRDGQGNVLESPDVLSRIARKANVPMYGMSATNVGLGIVGGYVYTQEANVAKLAEIALRIANGKRPQDIPIERTPETPMFDWRQLKRWNISEDLLPPGSVIQFRELTMWEQYKWRIVAVVAIILLQALLIGALLVEGHRARRARHELQENEEHLEQLVEQRTAEAVEARDQAMEANRAKSSFLANMSHELRTPLNAILGYSAMVGADANLSDQHRKDLAVVGSSGEHLLGLIDDVLDMAKIETGRTAVEDEAIDLHYLVNDTVNMMRQRAQAKNLELLLEMSRQTPEFVRSDAGKLRQILTNLVGNAVKYTDEGGIVVRLGARPGDNPRNRVLIFEVEDTGIGIAEEDQSRIFNPFVQAESPLSRKGTGLGLSICRHFVELLRGTIQLESIPGRGSRFYVEIPAQLAEASEVKTETANVQQVIGLEPGQPDYRILIVEDHKESWLLLLRLLQTAGFKVQVVEDGGRAVETFQTWRPHFIWMDIRLPVMSGLEAARRIREIEGSARKVKIAAATASAFDSQRDEVLASGFDDFLRKPYRPREIFDCMARHLGLKYVYGTSCWAHAGDPPATLKREQLASLPAALRDELEAALVSLDAKRIAMLVRRVSGHDAQLGVALGCLTGESAYSPILRALRSCKSGLVT